MIVPATPAGDARPVRPDVAAAVLRLAKQGQGRRIISMSLHGNDTRYTHGAVENALLAQRAWPGWTLRVYLGGGVPPEVVQVLALLGAELVPVRAYDSARGIAFARFLAAADPTAAYVIFRDADARLTPRDHAAVNEWLHLSQAQLKHYVHVMADEAHHGVAMMAGMWGVVGGFLQPQLAQQWGAENATFVARADKYGADQSWLRGLWPTFKGYALKHASWHCHKWGEAEWRGFPIRRRSATDFVGNIYQVRHGFFIYADGACAACRPSPPHPHLRTRRRCAQGLNDFQGIRSDRECPKQCRRKPDWVTC